MANEDDFKMIVEVYKNEMHVFKEFITRRRICKVCGHDIPKRSLFQTRCMVCGSDIKIFGKERSVVRRSTLPEIIYILSPEDIVIKE